MLLVDRLDPSKLAFFIDLDFFSFLCNSVPPELLLIKGLLNLKLDILVKLFPGLKLDLLINLVTEFCPEEKQYLESNNLNTL